MISDKIKLAIRDVPDFPSPGILFKDITPVLKDPELCKEITQELVRRVAGIKIDAVAGVESRGFLFGTMLASALNLPFVPIRKAGKLPYKTISQSYDLEYGSATIECHEDAFLPGQRVLLHDDLLATGGTMAAAAQLISRSGATIAGFSFLISLEFLEGAKVLQPYADHIHTLVSYA